MARPRCSKPNHVRKQTSSGRDYCHTCSFENTRKQRGIEVDAPHHRGTAEAFACGHPRADNSVAKKNGQGDVFFVCHLCKKASTWATKMGRPREEYFQRPELLPETSSKDVEDWFKRLDRLLRAEIRLNSGLQEAREARRERLQAYQEGRHEGVKASLQRDLDRVQFVLLPRLKKRYKGNLEEMARMVRKIRLLREAKHYVVGDTPAFPFTPAGRAAMLGKRTAVLEHMDPVVFEAEVGAAS